MLCDIVGFLSWASSREPIDVFALLQAVYGEFDRLCESICVIFRCRFHGLTDLFLSSIHSKEI